ncbi:MAG: Hsp20/alpha crystallin family protein, partial [Candidatus Acidiferrales bacterium]
ENLEVQVAPRSICISGTRLQKSEQNEGNTVYSERRCDRIFRVLDLPSQVDPDAVDLTLNDGILEIRVPKVAMVEKTAPLVKRASA